MAQTVVALVEDLVFTAKLRTAAQETGATLQTATQVEAFLQLIRSAAPQMVLVDLNFTRADALAVVAQVRELPGGKQATLVGYLSHVQAERAQQAVAAGCSAALPRSLFVQHLPTLLRDGAPALPRSLGNHGDGAPQSSQSATDSTAADTPHVCPKGGALRATDASADVAAYPTDAAT